MPSNYGDKLVNDNTFLLLDVITESGILSHI